MHGMLKRAYGASLERLSRAFPVVTILGPRQCGKTTLVREVLSDWTYVDMERPRDAAPFEADPEARLAQLGRRVVIDEAQRMPSLFPVLRGIIDANRAQNGQYVLLGSASPSLVRHISESLAGRTAFLDLPPFRWREVQRSVGEEHLETLWLRGGFPDAFLQKQTALRQAWFDGYTRTFIERDLPALGIDVSASQMRRLWTMLAHYNGGIWNASDLAASLGTSYHTVNRYVDILEQTFLVRKLPPYFANLGKRLIKSPKVYLRDTGLLHYFLGIRSLESLHTHPARGASWEALLVDQIISAYQLSDPAAQFYYWRTATGVEVDLLVETRSKIIPFEIKLHSAPKPALADSLVRCMADLGLPKGYVVYPGDEVYSLGRDVTAIPAKTVLMTPPGVEAIGGTRP